VWLPDDPFVVMRLNLLIDWKLSLIRSIEGIYWRHVNETIIRPKQVQW